MAAWPSGVKNLSRGAVHPVAMVAVAVILFYVGIKICGHFFIFVIIKMFMQKMVRMEVAVIAPAVLEKILLSKYRLER